jgi:integrase
MNITEFDEMIDEFCEHRAMLGAPETTLRAYDGDLRGLRDWISSLPAGAPAPDELELRDARAMEPIVAAYLNEMRTQWKPKTVLRRLGSFRTVWKYLDPTYPMLTAYNGPTPGRAIPHPLPGGIGDVLTMVAVAGNPRHRALVALCGLCGLRVGEAVAVTPAHYNAADRTLWVLGKGARERTVPVSDVAAKILDRAIGADAWVRMDAPLVGIKNRTARDLITELGVRAGVERHVTSHDLRATFATEVYAKTHDIRAVQELLGHASISQTETYVGITTAGLRAAANKAV